MIELSQKLVNTCLAKKLKLAVAESCTGGMVSMAITDIVGSSQVFDRGFITYSYESKTEILRVPLNMLQDYGAVSGEVATEMVIGTIKNSDANIALSITGIAGPSGATPNKPIGLVYFAIFNGGIVECHEKRFNGSRQEIRYAASIYGLELLLEKAVAND